MKTLCTLILKDGARVVVPVEIIRELAPKFGRRDFLVKPVGGAGEVAVNSSKLAKVPSPGSKD